MDYGSIISSSISGDGIAEWSTGANRRATLFASRRAGRLFLG